MFEDMETTLYQDDMANRDILDKLKSNMSLDLTGHANTKFTKLGQFLNSPEALPFLKLASPDLERMVIQHNGMVQQTNTPTPTQILFPKSVTEEQEAYARGFMDALAKLHQKQGQGDQRTDNTVMPFSQKANPPNLTSSAPFADTSAYFGALAAQSGTFVELQNASTMNSTAASTSVPNYYTTTTMLPGSVLVSSAPQPQYNAANYLPLTVLEQQGSSLSRGVKRTAAQAAGHPSQTAIDGIPQPQAYSNHPTVLQFKEEPQTVPSIEDGSPPLSPIDMDSQESQKVERKRARNRIAARKCRFRKLQQIQKLEERVDELKKENGRLSGDANTLKQHVATLKQQILEHVNSGCVVVMPVDTQR